MPWLLDPRALPDTGETYVFAVGLGEVPAMAPL